MTPEQLAVDVAAAERVRSRLQVAIARSIIRDAASAHGVTAAGVTGKRRHAQLVQARIEVAYRLRAQGWSLNQIGRALRRDHSTVSNLLRLANDITRGTSP